ncbi:GNAT family N-acetyltransferase [Rhizomicrobium palustre]|nr:GNAT family N-acetyltransferase [Rhizomicrobium palustre]
MAELSPAWFGALAETTLAAGECAEMAREGDAILPIAVSMRGARGLTAPYTTRYAPMAENVESARALGAKAKTYVRTVLRLDAMDAEDPVTAAFLDGLGQSGLALACYGHFICRREKVSGFTSYWAERPSRLRNTWRRKASAAEKAGAQFTVLRDNFSEAMKLYEAIREASWKGAEPHPGFLPLMVERLGAEGMVRMGLMRLGGEAVAAQIWLVAQGRATIFKLVHRRDHDAYSPGTLLTAVMAAAVLDSDAIAELDFGRGDDPYKRDWAKDCVRRIGVIAANVTTTAGLSVYLREILPMRMMRAMRRQEGENRAASVAFHAAPFLSAPERESKLRQEARA